MLHSWSILLRYSIHIPYWKRVWSTNIVIWSLKKSIYNSRIRVGILTSIVKNHPYIFTWQTKHKQETKNEHKITCILERNSDVTKVCKKPNWPKPQREDNKIKIQKPNHNKQNPKGLLGPNPDYIGFGFTPKLTRHDPYVHSKQYTCNNIVVKSFCPISGNTESLWQEFFVFTIECK